MATLCLAAVKEEPATKFAKDQLKGHHRAHRAGWKKKRRRSRTISAIVYAEAKGNGLRRQGAAHHRAECGKQDANERAPNRKPSWKTYMQALGML